MPNSSTWPAPWHLGHGPPVRVLLDILASLAGGAGDPPPVLELLAVVSVPPATLAVADGAPLLPRCPGRHAMSLRATCPTRQENLCSGPAAHMIRSKIPTWLQLHNHERGHVENLEPQRITRWARRNVDRSYLLSLRTGLARRVRRSDRDSCAIDRAREPQSSSSEAELPQE